MNIMDKLQRLASSNAIVAFIFIIWTLFITGLWLPRNWGFYGNGDWDLTYSTFEMARISVLKYHEWPSFQPYLSFGTDLNANPQATHASMFFIPVLLFGSFYGYKLSILLALIIGLSGARKLFLSIGGNTLVSTLLAFIFVGAPYFSRHIFEAGHSNFLYMLFLPWLFYHLNSYLNTSKRKHAVWSVLLLAQPIAGGAPLVFIFSVALMFLWVCGLLWTKQETVKRTSPFLLFTGIALLLNAWKILPVMALWKDSPRLVVDDSGINPLIWLHALGDYTTDTGTPHGWHEITIGFPIVLLFVIIYVFRQFPDYKKWLMLMLMLVWVGLGNFPSYANPWYLLNHYMPVFSSLRAPYRFGGLTLLILCIAYVRLHYLTGDNFLIYIVLIGVTVMQTLSFNAISRQMVFSPRLEDFNHLKQAPFTVVKPFVTGQDKQYIALRNETFVQNAYEPLNLKPVYDSLPVFISGGKIVHYSPNCIGILAQDTLVKLSLRYSENWIVKGEGRSTDVNGLLCISGSRGTIEVCYKNPAFEKGLAISALSFLIFGLLALVGIKKRKV